MENNVHNLSEESYNKLLDILFSNREAVLNHLAANNLLTLNDFNKYHGFLENHYYDYYLNLNIDGIEFDYRREKLSIEGSWKSILNSQISKQLEEYVEIHLFQSLYISQRTRNDYSKNQTFDPHSFLTEIYQNYNYLGGLYTNVIFIRKDQLNQLYKEYFDSNVIAWDQYYGDIDIELFTSLNINYLKDFGRILYQRCKKNITKQYIISYVKELSELSNTWVSLETLICIEHIIWYPADLLSIDKYLTKTTRISRSGKPINTYYGLSNQINIELSEELIERRKESWNWNDLSRNEKIPWTKKLIDKYHNRLSFSSLSSNKGVEWSLDLISKYADRWNWKSLSYNPSLPWCESLLDGFINNWTFKTINEDTYENALRDCKEGKLNPLDLALTSFEDKTKLSEPDYSISGNLGILWNDYLIKKYEDKIDLWSIAKYGNLTKVTLKNIESHLVNTYWTRSLWKRHGDTKWSIKIWQSGFEVLGQNKLTHIRVDDFEYYSNIFIEHEYPNKDIYSDEPIRKQWCVSSYFRENKIIGLNLKHFVEKYDSIFSHTNEYWTDQQYDKSGKYLPKGVWDLLEEIFNVEVYKDNILRYFSSREKDCGLTE